jgi:hypothetical protein
MNSQKAPDVEYFVETISDIQVGRGFRTFHKMPPSRISWYKHFKETGSVLHRGSAMSDENIRGVRC